ncbi:MAG: NlpC/P60 family protein [Nakamurella sp.]
MNEIKASIRPRRSAQIAAFFLASAVSLSIAGSPAASASPAANPETAPFAAPLVAAASAASPAALPYPGAPRLTSLVAFARTWAAKAPWYVYGGGHGSTPGPTGGGFDCSGWVRYAYWNAFGVDFGGGSANDVMRSGRFIRTHSPVPGDVVAFNYEGGSYGDHVGIFVGGTAPDGRPAMIHSPHTGDRLKLAGFGYGLIGYYRYVGATAADSGPLVRATSTSITVPASTDKGTIVSVTGRVTSGTAGVSSGAVRLFARKSGGAWATSGEVRVAANGTYRLTYRSPGTAVQLQVKFLGSGSAKPSTSAARTLGVTVRGTSTSISAPAAARNAQIVVVTGRVSGSPEVIGQTVRLYTRPNSNVGWTARLEAKVNGHSNYTLQYRMTGETMQQKVRFMGTAHAKVSYSAVRVTR